MPEKLAVDQSGAPQTMLATLHARAIDADLPNSILNDTWARDVVDRIDYDWSRTSMTPRNAASVSMRSAHFDTWTRQFLDVHPRATVLHLGCGLDSRYFRVDPGSDVEWYDVDYPDVAELRARLLPAREHRHDVAASVTEPGYLTSVPDDRPLHWAIDGPDDIRAAVPGTRLLAWVPVFESKAFSVLPVPYRVMAAVMNRVPGLRTMAQFHRYAFGTLEPSTG